MKEKFYPPRCSPDFIGSASLIIFLKIRFHALSGFFSFSPPIGRENKACAAICISNQDIFRFFFLSRRCVSKYKPFKRHFFCFRIFVIVALTLTDCYFNTVRHSGEQKCVPSEVGFSVSRRDSPPDVFQQFPTNNRKPILA
jgi:hypothetical protein